MSYIYINTVVYANQLQHQSATLNKDEAKTLYVELFNRWVESDDIFETYEECLAFQADAFDNRGDYDEFQFDFLLITMEETIVK